MEEDAAAANGEQSSPVKPSKWASLYQKAAPGITKAIDDKVKSLKDPQGDKRKRGRGNSRGGRGGSNQQKKYSIGTYMDDVRR